MIWQLVWKDVLAIVPIYGEDGGNYTEVWLVNGHKEVVRNRTTTVVKHLAKVFAIDVAQLKENMAQQIGQRRNVPLLLHEQLYLIPIQYRKPLGDNHGATGYVVYQHLLAVGKGGKVTFKNGDILQCLSQSRTVNGLVVQCVMRSNEINNKKSLSYE